MLRHLVTLGIEHKTRRNHVLESNAVENHRSNGVQGKEPTTRLVDTLVDEIAGESNAFVDEFGIFERIVYLSIRHRTRVKPHVNQV